MNYKTLFALGLIQFLKSQEVFKPFIKKIVQLCNAKTLEMDKGINDKITCMVYLQQACTAAGMNF